MAGAPSHFSNILHLPQTAAELSFLQVMQGLSCLPAILEALREQQLEIAALRAELKQQQPKQAPDDGWLGARDAARYMGVCPGTFDKLRYHSTPRLRGSKVDGKVLYKKSDLDKFIQLFDLKSSGLA